MSRPGLTAAGAPASFPIPTARCDTRLCELVGVRYPIVQTGMGWVAGPRLVAATAEAGGLGILASATMTVDELDRRHRRGPGRGPTRPSASTCAPTPPTSSERVALLVERGVKVASFAQAPRPDLVARLPARRVVVIPTVGARRHAEKVAEWGVDGVIAQGAEGGGHTGAGPDHAAAAPGGRRRGGQGGGHRRRRLLRRPRASSPRSPTERRASPWARASCSPARAPSPTR